MQMAELVRSTNHDDVATAADVFDGNHFSISADFVDEGIPYYRGQDVVGNFFIEQAAPNHITEEAFERSYMLRSHLKKGDVLLSIVGTIGELSLVMEEKPATCSCKLAIFRPRSITPEYMAVALQSSIGRLQIERLTRGAVQMGLILEDMDQLLVPRLSQTLECRITNQVQKSKHLRAQFLDGISQAEEYLTAQLGISTTPLPEPLAYSSSSKFIESADRLDSQYFMPAKTNTIDALSALPGSTIGNVFSSIREMVSPVKDNSLGLVRNFNLTHALEPVLDDEKELIEFEDVGSTKKKIRFGDVVISRLRSYLKEIALVKCCDAHPAVCSSEFIVLRPKRSDCLIAPETLMIFLYSQPVQTILKWCQDGSQHPRFSEKDLLKIPLPDAVAEASLKIENFVGEALTARRKSIVLISTAKRAVEIAVEQDELAANQFLDEVGE